MEFDCRNYKRDPSLPFPHDKESFVSYSDTAEHSQLCFDPITLQHEVAKGWLQAVQPNAIPSPPQAFALPLYRTETQGTP